MTHIYLLTVKKVTIIKKKNVTVEDIATLEGPHDLVERIKKVVVMQISEEVKKNYLLSIIDILHAINNKIEDINIHHLGENDIIICYLCKAEKQENKLLTSLKVAFVALVLFAGGIVAIMTFQIETQLSAVFSKFYFIVLGDNHLQPYLIEIPYAIGLATGIILFFNHFTKIKISSDPTPIEVELNLYKLQVEDSIIETLKEEAEEKEKK